MTCWLRAGNGWSRWRALARSRKGNHNHEEHVYPSWKWFMSYNLCIHLFNLCRNASQLSSSTERSFHSLAGERLNSLVCIQFVFNLSHSLPAFVAWIKCNLYSFSVERGWSWTIFSELRCWLLRKELLKENFLYSLCSDSSRFNLAVHAYDVTRFINVFQTSSI